MDLFEKGSFGYMIYDTPFILTEGFYGVKKKMKKLLAETDPVVQEEFEKIIF